MDTSVIVGELSRDFVNDNILKYSPDDTILRGVDGVHEYDLLGDLL